MPFIENRKRQMIPIKKPQVQFPKMPKENRGLQELSTNENREDSIESQKNKTLLLKS